MHEEPDSTTRTAHAVDALRQWLLTEDAFARGAATDGALNRQQDRIAALLGPHAVPTAHEHLRGHLARGGRIADLAGQPSQLKELLTLLRSTRRRGLEQQRSPAPKAQQDPRPSAVLVMAEHHGGEAVWNRPRGEGGPVRLSELGVPDALARRLRRWNATFEDLALSDFAWPSPQAHAAWVQQGLQLAHELQLQLPEVDVRYFHSGGDRPLRSR
ncbi:hypothetical protein [Kineococcus sp. SYSU DK005]|uniref:hypothetical protein n=1 Tax=Kineococcus sp. SYSU DK005 TaxID=3383126 RepID=UPI003D7CFF00